MCIRDSCCTSVHLPPPEAWAERAAAVLAAGTVGVVADTVVARWLTPAGAARAPETLAWLRAMLVATPPEGYAGCCGAIEHVDLRDDLASISAPALVIAGAEDPATPLPHLERIAEGIDGARLELLAGAAHLANVERPDVVTRLIAEHCAPEPAR